jgi:hypothetical protein
MKPCFEIKGRSPKGFRRLCHEETESGRHCLGSASRMVWILGRPFFLCPKHAREAQEIWDRALAGFPDESKATA